MESIEKAYILTVTPYQFYIQCLTTSSFFSIIVSSASKQLIKSSKNNFLKINRKTNKIQQITAINYEQHIQKTKLQQRMKFDLLIGCIIVNHQPYLLLASQISKVANYIEFPIFEISDVSFIPYRMKNNQKTQQIQDQNKIIQKITRYIKKKFYFSYKENIASALITQTVQQQQGFIFNQFTWNTNLLQDFRQAKISNCWTIPIIQGHIEEIHQNNMYFSYSYLSINRRSCLMSGTRFNSRGIDEQGNPSNFVQTQQIFKYHNNLYVHVSVRGSVPLFWKQIKVRSKINYVKDKDIDQEQILKDHYIRLQQTYKATVTTINLLSKQKSPQKQLKNRFQSILNRSIKLPYLFFDLNQQFYQQNKGQQSVNKFIKDNQQIIFGKNKFLLMQNITKQIIQLQSVYISRYLAYLELIVLIAWIEPTLFAREQVNYSSNLSKITQDSISTIEENKIYLSEKFMNKFITIWANIGDKISQIYCGTSSVASHIIKKQSNNIFNFLGGAFKSLNRYINANVSDILKQESIDCLLGNKGQLSQTQYFKTNIILNHIKPQKYCQFKTIKVSLLTFSLNYITSIIKSTLQNFLYIIQEQSDIIILNIQEINSYQLWLQKMNNFMSNSSYEAVIHHYYQKAYLFTVIYVKKQTIKTFNVNFIQIVQIPLKAYGAIALFFKVESSLFCVINCKLQSGYHNSNLRINDFNEIHLYLQRETYHSHFLKKSDCIFIAGNMNFRLSSNIQKEFKFKNLIEEIHNNYLKVEKNDVLIKQALYYDEFYDKASCDRYSNYDEGQIKFYPTYKLIGKRAQFDKNKYPAWCDRILYSTQHQNLLQSYQHIQNNKINCLKYERIQQNFNSSHKAVTATFSLKIKIQNIQLKKKLIQSYLYV